MTIFILFIWQGISQFRGWYSTCLHKAPWLSSESMPHPICSMVYFPTVGSFLGKRVCEHSIRGAFLGIASLPSKRLKPPVTTRVQKPNHVPLYPFYSSIIIKTFQCISIIKSLSSIIIIVIINTYFLFINHYHHHCWSGDGTWDNDYQTPISGWILTSMICLPPGPGPGAPDLLEVLDSQPLPDGSPRNLRPEAGWPVPQRSWTAANVETVRSPSARTSDAGDRWSAWTPK